MEKRLEHLEWKCMWVSHLGCIKGCLDYLKIDVSDGWLFGGTGHAFLINIHDSVCPSGPTAWHTEMLFTLGKNIGYNIDGVWCHRSDEEFSLKQRSAWDQSRKAIDAGLPCYGWELHIPEYYVVHGYDDSGYYYTGPGSDAGRSPKPWKELGDSLIGWLEMYWLRPGKAADDPTVVREALAFALEFAQSPDKWIYRRYKAGLSAYDSWIKALRSGDADGFGVAYNAAVWAECRRMAVEFLKEAKSRIARGSNGSFDSALSHYGAVAENLEAVAKTFPFPPEGKEIEDSDRRDKAVEYLKAAKKAEDSGLKSLEKVVTGL